MSVTVNSTAIAYSTLFDSSSNSFTATNVQEAIEEVGGRLARISAVDLTATDLVTTSSTAAAAVPGMSLTPVAGTYVIWFSTSVQGSAVSVSLYLGDDQREDTVRKAEAVTGWAGISIQGVVTVDGTQPIGVRWSSGLGVAACGPRTLTALRIL